MMIYVDTDRCTGCGTCVKSCPAEAISLKNGKALIDERKCVYCFACVGECSQHAIIAAETVEPQRLASPSTTLSKSTPASVVSVEPAPITTIPIVQKALLPAMGAGLMWAGREVLPRLFSGLANRLSRSQSAASPERPGGKQRRLRKRHRQK